MKKVDTSSNLNSRIKIFADWLNNGGVETIWSKDLLEDLIKVKFDTNGNVVEKSVSSLVRAAILAYEGTQLTAPMPSKEYMTEYQTTLQKSLFFDQINIETEEDFDEIFEENINAKNILYRGVSEAKWRLYSSLQRVWLGDKIYEKDIDYGTFIKRLITNAKTQQREILVNFFKKNGISPNNDIAVLSFLQHYGSPTPLIDWTNSFINSLYFATFKIQNNSEDVREIEHYFSVYHIKEEYLTSSSLVNFVENGISEMQEHVKKSVVKNGKKEGINENEMNKFFSNDRLELTTKMLHQKKLVDHITKIDRLMTFPLTYFSDNNEENDIQFSLNNNMNIINQKGVFIWNSDPVKPIEEVGNEQIEEKEQEIYRFSKCYNINKKLEEYIKGKLIEYGIDENFIYPKPELIAKKSFEDTIASC